MPIRFATIWERHRLNVWHKNMRSTMFKVQCLLAIALLLAACATETYDSGDGKYSMMRADLVETHTDCAGELVCGVTDDGD